MTSRTKGSTFCTEHHLKNKSIKFQRCQNIKMYNIQFVRRSSKILHLRWKGGVGLSCAYKLRHPRALLSTVTLNMTQHVTGIGTAKNVASVKCSCSFTLQQRSNASSTCLKLSFCEMWNQIKRQLFTLIENLLNFDKRFCTEHLIQYKFRRRIKYVIETLTLNPPL